jgi:hypothetical protein
MYLEVVIVHLFCGFLILSFLPTVIALLRESRSTVGVFLVNLFLGWTVIGWFVALIWAASSEKKYCYAMAPYVRRY